MCKGNMRELTSYIVIILMGAMLGISGGVAATFAVSEGGGGSSTDDVPSFDDLISGGSQREVSGGPSSIRDTDDFPGRGQTERRSTDSMVSDLSAPSIAGALGQRQVAAGSPSASSPPVGIELSLVLAVPQAFSRPGWSREFPANALFIRVGDVTRNGVVDVEDLALLALALGTTSPQPPWLDLTGDGIVDFEDLKVVARSLAESGP